MQSNNAELSDGAGRYGRHVSRQKLTKRHNKRALRYQIIIFTLTYLSYASLHFVREGWSILKPKIETSDGPGLNWEGTTKMGIVDFFFLFSYAIGLFISGIMGDNFPIRLILPIGYLIVAGATIFISYGGTWEIDDMIYYIAFFIISGFCQSIGWPSYIAVMGNWFSEKNRGLIFGLWTTCQNLGNIIGNVITNFLIKQCNMEWMWAFRTLGLIIAFFGILNAFFLIDHPTKLNILITSEREDEQILNQDNLNRQSSYANAKEDEAGISEEEKSSSGENQIKDNNQSVKFEYGDLEDPSRLQAIGFLNAWLIPGVIPFAL